MKNEDDGIVLEMSPELRQAVDELVQTGTDVMSAVKQLAATRPDLFTTPADEIVRMLGTWD
jgi:hypothetical protein